MANKTAGTLVATATTCSANGSVVSTTADLSLAYSSVITAQVVNGIPQPIMACQVTVNISNDQVNWRQYRQGTASIVPNTVSNFAFDLSEAVLFANVVFSGNDQDVVVESFIHILNS